MTSLRIFWPVFRAQGRRFSLALALGLATLLAGVALLGVSGWFLTAAAITTAAASFDIFAPSSAVRGLSLVRILSRYAERLAGHDATLRSLSEIRAWLFTAMLPQAMLMRASRRGDLVARLTSDVDALDVVFLLGIAPLTIATVAAVAVTAMLTWVLPGAAAVYGAAMLAACVGVPFLLIATSRRAGARVAAAAGEARALALDAVEGHADIITCRAEGDARSVFMLAAERLASARRRTGMGAALATGSVTVLAGTALVAVLGAGLPALESGAISGPVLAGLLLSVLGSFEAAAPIVRGASRLTTAAASAERLQAVAGEPSAAADTRERVPLPADPAIRFASVTFGYDPRRPVLRDVSLTIRPGDRIAIAGPSGCGKSSLLLLLLGLVQPDRGLITIGGVDIRAAAERDLHARVALLEQDAPVFIGSIRENLLIGRCDADDAALWEALERARLADVVRGLPQGLDAPVGEGGRTLSAGQARRLCLARTLLSRADILALDEPTSGLDPESERSFLIDLAAATSGRTVILVTHANIPDGGVDRCYRLREGALQAIGRRGDANRGGP